MINVSPPTLSPLLVPQMGYAPTAMAGGAFRGRLERLGESPAPEPAAPSLDDLRRRMADILSRSALGTAGSSRREPAPPPAPEDPGPPHSDLPFICEPTASGPLYVRRIRLSVAQRVGRISVTDAATASGEMLALFALDPTLAGRDLARALYLDIETTGLSGGAGTVPFLIGLAWFEQEPRAGGRWLVVEQLLLRQLGEEAPMLERVASLMREASALVSFNGKAFDLPLLRTRFVMNRQTCEREPPHLDLLHIARRLHGPRIGACNLGRVESYVLGFEREGDIPGADVAGRYGHFLRTGDDSGLGAVIVHNEQDVVAMAAMVALYGEPMDRLDPSDLAAAARSLTRAKAAAREPSLRVAEALAQTALDRGAGGAALRARAEVAKARGDKARALADFAALLETVADPALHLELAKLYEHHAKAPLAALAIVQRGTTESEEETDRRVKRLGAKQGKLERAAPRARGGRAPRKV